MQQLNLFGQSKEVDKTFTAKKSKSSEEEAKFELEIISVKMLSNLKLSIRQVRLLIEALEVYKIYIKENKKVSEFQTKLEFERTEELFEFLQDISGFNYEKACNKCINKYKKKDKDEIGLETFIWMKD